jgi:hypothetical protein
LKIRNVIPKHYRFEKGLRPSETKEFTLRINEYPINSASFVIIKINSFVFGNKNKIELKIPTEKIKKMQPVNSKSEQFKFNQKF